MKKSIKKTGREKRAAFFTRLAERQKPAENTPWKDPDTNR